jgi:hypothetical protein
MSIALHPWDRKGYDMDESTGRGEAWAQLIREIIASWRLLLGAVVLVLACAPVAIVVILVLIG